MRKILILGWADLAKGASEGGGYNLVAQNHVLALSKIGCEVFFLQSGVHFRLKLNGKPGKSVIRETSSWKNIRKFRLVNSRNRAPSIFNIRNTINQIEDYDHQKLVADWIQYLEITEVFIHSLEGHPLGLIPYLKKSMDISVKVFCHDHFYICPQVNLLFNGSQLCTDYNDGKKCMQCMGPEFGKRHPLHQVFKHSHFKLIRDLYFLYINRWKSETIIEPVNSDASNANKKLIESINVQNSDNYFSLRRKGAAEVLSAADRVFAPSLFITTYLGKIGVDENKIEHVQLGLPHLDSLGKISTSSGHNSAVPHNFEMRFCYRGSELYHKGLKFLLDTLLTLPLNIRRTINVIVRGTADPGSYKNYERELPKLKIYGKYLPEELASFIDEYDVGISPHLWFENSPVSVLEHLACGKPVLAADIGGVEDYIREGETGWLFEAGNRDSLKQKILSILKNGLPDIPNEVVNSFDFFLNQLGKF